MRAGNLRDRITFQRQVCVPDGAGGSSCTWEVLFETIGELQMFKGKEVVSAGRIAASATGILSLRYSRAAAGLNEADMAVIEGETFNIRSIHDPERRKRRLEFLLERGVAV